MTKTIVVACDHGGFPIKEYVIDAIREYGCEVIDVGTYSADGVDYPDFAQLGAEKILSGKANAGVFMCGSGVGICITANKIHGIYAAICHDTYSARQGVEHDLMNVLCLGGRIVGPEVTRELVTAFLGGVFNEKPNQVRRVEKMKRIENGDMYLADKFARRYELGQSVWIEIPSNDTLRSESVQSLVKEGKIRGLTFEPCSLASTLLVKNKLGSNISAMVFAKWPVEKILNSLSVNMVREATGILRDKFVETSGRDGMVMLQLDPTDTGSVEKLVSKAKTIWTKVNRPNLMIGIQATAAGIEAAEQLLREGINICLSNVLSKDTLNKSLAAHRAAMEQRASVGQSNEMLQFGIQVPVGALDRVTDSALNGSTSLGICQAAVLVQQAGEFYKDAEVERLTGNAAVPWKIILDVSPHCGEAVINELYAEAMIERNTVLSAPASYLSTLTERCPSTASLFESANHFLNELASSEVTREEKLGIVEVDMNTEYQSAFEAMAGELAAKGDAIRKSLGPIADAIYENYSKIESESMITRIFAKDPTVWTFDTQAYPEIRNRLGWLDSYKTLEKSIAEYQEIAADLKAQGFKKVLLLGMGGSSLAPEVLALTFPQADGLKLQIVDSTDPDQVLAAERANPVEETVYIVSSKSGGTAEVRALMDYFYERAKATLGDKVGSHFIAITDPGTLLERHATSHSFRHVVLADASIGGRFSALSPFGILPAVLIGVDPQKIIAESTRMAKNCAPSNEVGSNQGAALGVFMGTAALNGKDKLTILTDPEMAAFGSWLEQLIAESSGKDGKGIVPIDLEPELPLEKYAKDRAFVYIETSGTKLSFCEQLVAHGHPLMTIHLSDLHEIFAEFYRWEIAISVACGLLGVNAFDQPNVQDSKTRTVAKINDYKEKGALPSLPVTWERDGMTASFVSEVSGMKEAADLKALIRAFVEQAKAGEDYIAINAYLPRNEGMTDTLQSMRKWIGELNPCATTLGFGPRFQHSTGQLHKGGANNGLFIQLVGNPKEDREIPSEGMTFSVLEKAQALGDLEALLSRDRRVLRIDLGERSLADFF